MSTRKSMYFDIYVPDKELQHRNNSGILVGGMVGLSADSEPLEGKTGEDMIYLHGFWLSCNEKQKD